MSVSSRVNACLNSTSTVHACKVLVELHIIYDLNEVMPQERSIGPSQKFRVCKVLIQLVDIKDVGDLQVVIKRATR